MYTHLGDLWCSCEKLKMLSAFLLLSIWVFFDLETFLLPEPG